MHVEPIYHGYCADSMPAGLSQSVTNCTVDVLEEGWQYHFIHSTAMIAMYSCYSHFWKI